jgi:lysophospholipase L1-like esterase
VSSTCGTPPFPEINHADQVLDTYQGEKELMQLTKTLLAATLLGVTSTMMVQTTQAIEPQNIAPVAAQVVRARGGLGNVWPKLQAGKDVTIAYFGGSITVGSGASNVGKTSYRALMTQWFRQKFPQSKITEVNAAIGGTGSDLGAFRMGHDVLRHQPDLIFVEYAVNDSGYSNELILRGMEGIIRQAWRANPLTDLCFIYTYQTNQQADFDKGFFHRAAGVHDTLAEYYGIPAISVATPIAQMIREGKMLGRPTKDAEGNAQPVPAGMLLFANDGVHPLDVAMASYAQTIQEALPQLAAVGKPGPHTLKTPLMADNWENAKLVPIEQSMLSAGWKKLSADEEGLGKTFGNRMPAIWEATKPGEKLTFKFRGTAARIYDLLGPDAAQVWITLDGKKSDKPVARFDSYSSYHRPGTLSIGSNLPDGEHTVEIEIDAQQPDRSSVTDKESKKPDFNPNKYNGTAWRIGGLLLIGDIVK